jgi:hypothetical protein
VELAELVDACATGLTTAPASAVVIAGCVVGTFVVVLTDVS